MRMPDPYPAEKARQGSIVLRKPWQRAVFFTGLGLSVVMAILTRILFGGW